jgi:hypothetical protein
MGAGLDRSPPSRRTHDAASGAIATLAHAAVLALAWGFSAGHRPEPPAPPPPQTKGLIEIDLREEARPNDARPSPTAAPEASAAAVAGGRGDGRIAGVARWIPPDVPIARPPEGATAPSASPGAAAAPTSEYEGPPPEVPMGGGGPSLGVASLPIGALANGADVPGAQAPAAPTGPIVPKASVAPGGGATLLRDAMRAHDRELGLGTPGATAISNAVASAVRASTVPVRSKAVLVARIGGDGAIVSLSVHSFDAGDVKTWSGVAAAVLGAIGKKKLGIAGLGPKGAIVQIDVRSAVVLPSGADSSHSLIPPTLDLLRKGPPRDVMPAPSPDGDDGCVGDRWSEVKPLCGVGMKVGSFDAADMVADKHRTVKATFQVKLLDDDLAPASPAAPAAPQPPSSSAAAAPSAPRPDAGAP